MDMSAKLNLSYPALASVPVQSQVSPTTDAVKSTTAESLDKKAQPVQRAELEQAVKDIQEFVTSAKRNLEFSIDDSTQKVVVKVVATDSGEVIRQLPTEAALKLAQSLSDAGSVLFDEKA